MIRIRHGRKTDWHISDVLDLEFFLSTSEHEDRNHAAGTDRDVFLNYIVPNFHETSVMPRRYVIKEWLVRRRQMERAQHPDMVILPGDIYSEVYKCLAVVCIIIGAVAGSGIATTLLSYSGIEPVNVGLYLSVLVLCQIGLMAFTFVLMVIRWRQPVTFRNSVLYGPVSNLVASIALKLKKKTTQKLPSSKQYAIKNAFGLLRGRQQVYGDLLFWPIFVVFQSFGITFNIGVLGATLLRVLSTDLAFGWQSTLQLSAGTVHELVQGIALPWAWFVPSEFAYPALSQIEGSHMVLKDGIYHLTTLDLVAWWPFLCLSVAFYSLLPRVLLFLFAKIRMHRALKKLDFNHSDVDRLMRRLQTPRVSSKGQPSLQNSEFIWDRQNRPMTPETCTEPAVMEHRQLVALIPDEIYDKCPMEELRHYIGARLKAEICGEFRFSHDIESDKKLIQHIGRLEWRNGTRGVFILQEAWQPPIQEFLTFLSVLRETLGERVKIEIGLIGRPNANTIFTALNENDWWTWHSKLRTIGDAYLGLERLRPNE